jgi:hypothetical protein
LEDLYKRCKSTKPEHINTPGQGKYYAGGKLMLVIELGYVTLYFSITNKKK